MKFCTFVGASIILLGGTISRHAATPVSFNVDLHSDGQPVTVSFRAWLPDGVNRIKGLMLNLPGSNGDTRNITTNGSWQALLPGMGFGIVGMRDVFGNVDYTFWGTSPAEASANLQSLLDAVANSYGHPEIKNAPIMLDGLSKGAFASSYLASLVPNRVLGYVGDKGFGDIGPGVADEGALSHVPGMIIAGSTDTTVTPYQLFSNYQYARSEGAHVGLEIEWGTGHNSADPQARYAFIAQAIRARYPVGQLPSLTPGAPLPLVASPPTPWLGQANSLDMGDDFSFTAPFLPINDPKISPLSNTNLDPNFDSWLPNKAMALVYRAQNDASFNGIGKPLSISALNVTNNAMNTGQPIDLGITLTGTGTYHVELFHNDDLIAAFDQAAGLKHFLYAPGENGMQTFIVTAKFTKNGAEAFTSSYVTVGVSGAPEPATLGLAVLAFVGIRFFAARPGAARTEARAAR